jgi:hypothetical protein
VILLEHNAAVLEVPVDTGRLYDGDELYQLAVELVVEMVSETRDRGMREE